MRRLLELFHGRRQIDLLKRHGVSGNTTQSFPSTADIAVRPIMSRLEHLSRTNETWRSFPRSRWTEFIDRVEPLTGGQLGDERVHREHPVIGHFDGGLLLESRLYELIDSPANREQAQRALASFFHDLGSGFPGSVSRLGFNTNENGTIASLGSL